MNLSEELLSQDGRYRAAKPCAIRFPGHLGKRSGAVGPWGPATL